MLNSKILSILLLVVQFSYSNNKVSLLTIEDYEYYYIKCDNQKSNKFLFHLHGGVSNPAFDCEQDISLSFLIENNTDFISSFKVDFNIILPIKKDSLNWIDNYEYVFSQLELVKSRLINDTTSKSEVYISGFSDGGTGAFKIFYDFEYFFDGLLVFNGFPQHNNFSASIDYNSVKQKTIIHVSTQMDKQIPYEFQLVEFRKQRLSNKETYIYIKQRGGHSFDDYTEFDFKRIKKFIYKKFKSEMKNKDVIYGFSEKSELMDFYLFRRKIYRKYNFGLYDMQQNRLQCDVIKSLKKSNKKILIDDIFKGIAQSR